MSLKFKLAILISLIVTISSLLIFAQDNPEKQKPKAVYQVEAAKVTVWENTIKGENGDYKIKNYQVQKVYQKDGKWYSSSSFNEKELLQLKEALEKAIVGEEINEY